MKPLCDGITIGVVGAAVTLSLTASPGLAFGIYAAAGLLGTVCMAIIDFILDHEDS